MRKKRSELEVAEETVEAARQALRGAEDEVEEIRGYIAEAFHLGDEEWLTSLRDQLEWAIQQVHRLQRAVREEQEWANRERPN
jgi:ubiquinone biosynthesis protein UbiJ